PLTSITVYAEYLLKKAEARVKESGGGPGAEDDIVKLRRISEGAQRILSFARELVQYAKPTGDAVAAVSVNGVVRQSLSFCEHLFERSGTRLVQTLTDDLPLVFAVPGQLEQVVINLVTNAVHACGEGGMVEVETRAVDPSAVVIAVGDSGPGIAPGDRER